MIPPAAELADRLTLASMRLTRWLRAVDAAAQLSGPQASAISVVVHSGRIRMSDLARLEEVSRPTITRLAGELQARGLVERQADPDDGRVVWLAPTPEGRRLLAEGQSRRIAPLTAAIERLSAEALADLLAGLAVTETLLEG
ncbi:MAG: MarR family transcriptional regulator [Caulobacter sp.]|nr:MarR family transcriptional regulator [Caulobacter sp.]